MGVCLFPPFLVITNSGAINILYYVYVCRCAIVPPGSYILQKGRTPSSLLDNAKLLYKVTALNYTFKGSD